MSLVPERKTRSYEETRKRSSNDYVKFTEDFKVVLRILDDQAVQLWKHWLPEANKGKGIGFVCPNVSAQTRICPIDAELEGLDKEDAEVRNRKAKPKFAINVLDRTPYTVCSSCNEPTPGKNCLNCKADLKKNTFTPLNKVKILEHGPRLFREELSIIENDVKSDLGKEITEYDIVFSTRGTYTEKKIKAMPQLPPTDFQDQWLLDAEGNPQTKFNLELLAEPPSLEEIRIFQNGGGMKDVNEARGIE